MVINTIPINSKINAKDLIFIVVPIFLFFCCAYNLAHIYLEFLLRTMIESTDNNNENTNEYMLSESEFQASNICRENILFDFFHLNNFKNYEYHLQNNSSSRDYRNFTSFPSKIIENSESRDHEVFVKSISLIDISELINNKYPYLQTKSEILDDANDADAAEMEKEKEKKYESKINNKMNSAHVEILAAKLAASLTEKNVCPHFPIVYDSLKATVKEFYVDTQNDLNDNIFCNPYFKKGLKEKRWEFLDNPSFSSNNSSFFKKIFSLHTGTDDDDEDDNDDDDEDDNDDDNDDDDDENDDDDDDEDDDDDDNDEDDENNEEDDDANWEDCSDDEGSESSESSEEEDSDEDVISITSLSELNIETLNFKCNEISEEKVEICEINENQFENLDITKKRKTKSNLSVDSDDEMDTLIVYDVPCTLLMLECFDIELEEVLKEDYSKLNETNVCEFDNKWIAIMMQVLIALIALRKHYNMKHNDLHSQNILFERTEKECLFYKVDSKYYKVPTYGYIIKIIDFGRATFDVNNYQVMGDVFESEGDAGDQYTYKYGENVLYEENDICVNPAFDLCRLACSIYEEIIYRKKSKVESKFIALIKSWLIDKYDKKITRYEGFKLYKKIATNMTETCPFQQLNTETFQSFCIPFSEFGEVYELV